MLIMWIKSIKNRENINYKSMKIKIQGHLTTLYMIHETPVYILLLSRQSSIFDIPYFLQTAHKTCYAVKYLINP